jgi:Cysteine-rich secretory protein family
MRASPAAGIAALVLLFSASATVQDNRQDLFAGVRSQSRRLVTRLATDGYQEAARICFRAFSELNTTEKDIEAVRTALERDVDRPERKDKLEAAIKEASRIAEACMAASRTMQGVEASRIARIALRFDSQVAAANEVLGNVRSEEQRWITPEQAAGIARRNAIAEAIAKARALPVHVTPKKASDPILLELLGKQASAVEHEGLVFESYLPEETLTRTVEDVVRAMAFSNWLVHDQMIPRHELGKIIHLPSERYEEFLAGIVATGRMDPRNPTPDARRAFEYVLMQKPEPGIEPSYAVATAGMRAHLGPVVLALYDRSLPWWNWNTWHQEDPDIPFWFVVGHIGLVCMNVLGAAPPAFSERVVEETTTARPLRHAFVLGDAGIMGCRSYLRDLAREGKVPPLSSCVLSQFGKIVGEKRLKAISVVEYLHGTNAAAGFLSLYAELHHKDDPKEAGATNPTDRAELALRRKLPEVDVQWEDWILGAERDSVRDALESKRPPVAFDDTAQMVLYYLNIHRTAAGLGPVGLDRELSAGAEQHAAYLALYPDQASRWPDAHDEQSDLEGFSPSGAWAGAHSVISNGPPKECIDLWLATFYHRLPLLQPGLLRVGYGQVGGVSVLDAGSMVNPGQFWEAVWPYDGQTDVPRTFPGELPPPVPDRLEPNSLGYPVTIQLGPYNKAGDLTLELLDTRQEPVPCIASTPTSPSNKQLAPDQAWCLIPLSPLGSN